MAKKNSIDFFRAAYTSIRTPEKRRPVYYFYGDESFFSDLLQDEIINLVHPDQRDFNMDLLYGNESEPGTVLEIARSFPMMSDTRVVVVRDFSKLRSEEGHINDFIPYFEQPNPSTILCLVDEKTPDKRTRLGKLLDKSDNIYSQKFDKLPDYRLSEWTQDWIRSQFDKDIDPQAAQILAHLVGNNLKLLSTEIDKVCTFVDTGNRISVEDVKKIIGSYREYSVIELKEAVIKRNLVRSLEIAEQILQKSNRDTGEVIRTVGFFYSVFGNIWQILRLEEKGLTKSGIQQEMGINNNWYFNQLYDDASGYTLAEIPQIYEALLDADMASKGFSTLDTSSILLLLVKRMITG